MPYTVNIDIEVGDPEDSEAEPLTLVEVIGAALSLTGSKPEQSVRIPRGAASLHVPVYIVMVKASEGVE